MIKDIQQAGKSYTFSDFILYEKLDMFYFKVIINSSTCTILSHKHKIITETDMIINSMWRDVYNFVNENIVTKQEIIAQKYEHLIIGFFYCPIEMPLNISYKHFFNKNNQNSNFIINNIKDKNNNELNISDFCLDIKLLNIRGIGGGPIINFNDKVVHILNEYKDDKISKKELLSQLNNNVKTFSGNDINDIEGIIIKDNKNIYQIKINSSDRILDNSRIEYELVIKDFIDIWNNIILDKSYIGNDINTNYKKIVSDIFIQYIENSNITSKIKNDKNLMPPGNSYIGDISYELIDNKNIETICKLNNTYKNIFRILYKGLKHHRKNNKYNTILNNYYINKWNEIVDIISYKIH